MIYIIAKDSIDYMKKCKDMGLRFNQARYVDSKDVLRGLIGIKYVVTEEAHTRKDFDRLVNEAFSRGGPFDSLKIGNSSSSKIETEKSSNSKSELEKCL